MRVAFLLIFLISFSFDGQAQFESSKKKVNISARPDKAPKKKAILPQNPQASVPPVIKFESKFFKNPDDKFLQGLPELPKVGDIQPKTYDLKKPSDDFTQKFNEQLKEDGISPELFNRDMNLGDFTVYAPQITIGARDYGVIDGDLVRIWLNGELVKREVYLESDFKSIILQLKKGNNLLEIEALNYGELSPNTGQFNFFDENKELITVQYWNLGIGYRARITINYEDKILKKLDEK
jgi:hypothetical protein